MEECEYYLFIDFKREQIIEGSREDLVRYVKDKSKTINHRGSLFSNQELAIATYLTKPIIAFQENGVKDREGILGAIQANVKHFDNRKNLVNRVIQKVHEDWTTNWRNEITFQDTWKKIIPPEHVLYGQNQAPAWFFHINVRNLHKDLSARNCVAYLEGYKDISNKTTENIPEPVELKWKGMIAQSMLIPPKMSRKIDAVFFFENNPHLAHIGINPSLSDLSTHYIRLEGVKTFHLHLVVYSDNFSAIRSSYVLKIGNRLSETSFYRVK